MISSKCWCWRVVLGARCRSLIADMRSACRRCQLCCSCHGSGSSHHRTAAMLQRKYSPKLFINFNRQIECLCKCVLLCQYNRSLIKTKFILVFQRDVNGNGKWRHEVATIGGSQGETRCRCCRWFQDRELGSHLPLRATMPCDLMPADARNSSLPLIC